MKPIILNSETVDGLTVTIYPVKFFHGENGFYFSYKNRDWSVVELREKFGLLDKDITPMREQAIMLWDSKVINEAFSKTLKFKVIYYSDNVDEINNFLSRDSDCGVLCTIQNFHFVVLNSDKGE